MDITLNNYIKRSDELTGSLRDQNEIKLMIQYLENTLAAVSRRYVKTSPIFNAKKLIPVSSPKKVNNTTLYLSNTTNVNMNILPELNQYSIKINNLVLRGNIGNIYDKRNLLDDSIIAHQVTPCHNRNNCSNIRQGQYCKFYHDPLDLLELKKTNLITSEYYASTIKLVRNFASTSWMYSNHSGIKNMRCIGSKENLANDIKIARISPIYKQSIETMKQQVMHDILVLLVLCNDA